MLAKRISLDELICDLKAKAVNHSEYFHYTRLEYYEKMMQEIDLPENGGVHRLLWLTPATRTNDGLERKNGDHAYLGCFTYSHYENVGMWFMYGKEKSDAIRIGFDNAALKSWLCKGEGGKIDKTINIYGVIDNKGQIAYKKIPSSEIENVMFCDVAYVLSKEDIEHHKWDGNVEWHRDYYHVTSTDRAIVRSCGNRLVSDDFTDVVCRKLPFCFKKKGWSGEREVRLIVTLKPKFSKRFSHVAIPFDEPLKCIDDDTARHITLSPWYEKGEIPSKINETNAKRSVFWQELNFKSRLTP